jgi:Ca2+-binding RTX toxin-like protein
MTTILSSNDDLYSVPRPDTVLGLSGNDSISSNGKSLIYGNAGNDTLTSGSSGDFLYGGKGFDLLISNKGSGFLSGDNDRDTLIGFKADTLLGGADDDYIVGGTGGASLLYGNTGDDLLYANGTGDMVYGGQGKDYIALGTNAGSTSGRMWVQGDFGNDTIIANTNLGRNTLLGGSDDDYLVGNGSGLLYGQVGNDTLISTGIGDKAYGGLGNDKIIGSGFSILSGDAGDDTINFTGTGSATLKGGDGNDYVTGGGASILYGNTGNDTLYGLGTQVTLYGGKDSDYLYGTASRFYGDKDNDTIIASDGSASVKIDGGDGDDYLNASALSSSSPVTITGGVGNDSMWGGNGADIMTGGTGNDFFYFTNLIGTNVVAGGASGAGINPFGGTSLVDSITDFTSGSDKIYLQKSGFGTLTGLTSTGPLGINNFTVCSRTSSVGTTSGIVEDNSSGIVYYSAGNGSYVALFKVQSGVTLASSDIVLF